MHPFLVEKIIARRYKKDENQSRTKTYESVNNNNNMNQSVRHFFCFVARMFCLVRLIIGRRCLPDQMADSTKAAAALQCADARRKDK